MKRVGFFLVFACVFPSIALADKHEMRLPLVDGKISAMELSRHLADDLHLPAGMLSHIHGDAKINLRGVSGWLAMKGLNSALGDGFQITIADDALIIDMDVAKLPKDWNATAGAVRKFTEITAPEATARQHRHLGLLLPQVVDPTKPMVIVIHGFDGDARSCRDMQECIEADGRQSASFSYPGEQPVAESAVLLAKNIGALRDAFPTIKIDLATESMGGLVAREFIEGPKYTGGINHLILIAPPNGGSGWTKLALLEKAESNWTQWRNEKDWSPTWMITQGLDEAGGDLKPGSKFLGQLNARPRREGVKYTIIAGDQPVTYRVEAEVLEKTANLFPGQVANWWGFRQTHAAIENKAEVLHEKTGASDGPVKVSQAKLDGVEDFVEVPADHLALYHKTDGKPPAAWAVVRDRLDK